MKKQKENSLGNITWSEMGKQNIQAKEVHSFRIQNFPLWRADSNSCGLACRIRRICVDVTGNPQRKSCGFKNIRIRLDGTLLKEYECDLDTKFPLGGTLMN